MTIHVFVVLVYRKANVSSTSHTDTKDEDILEDHPLTGHVIDCLSSVVVLLKRTN